MAGEQSVAELILKIVADSTEVRKALRESADATDKFNKDTKKSSDEASDAINDALDKTKEKSEKTNKTLVNFGSGMRQVSRNLAQFSAIIMGPVVGALAVAAKTNYSVSTGLRNMGIATQLFSNEIANAALPMVKKFTDWIFQMVGWFQKLPEAQKKSIIETALWVGGITASLAVVARLVFLLSKLPLLFWQVSAAGAAAFAGWKIGEWIRDITSIDNALSGPTGLFTKMFTWFDKLKVKFKEWQANMIETQSDWSKEDYRIPGGPGTAKSLAPATPSIDLGKITVKATEASQAIIKLNTAWTKTVEGFDTGLQEAAKKFGSWGQMMQNFAMGIATSMSSAFSDFFFDMFSGEMKSMEEYAASFGKAIVKMIADLIAQLIAMWMIVQVLDLTPTGRAVVSMLGWGAMSSRKHEGGYISKAHEGLSVGEVPIIAQKGEGILSRNGMASLGGEDRLNQINNGNGVGGGTTINLVQAIQAWGPEDVYRNRKMLAAGMAEELERNGAFRTAIKKYR